MSPPHYNRLFVDSVIDFSDSRWHHQGQSRATLREKTPHISVKIDQEHLPRLILSAGQSGFCAPRTPRDEKTPYISVKIYSLAVENTLALAKSRSQGGGKLGYVLDAKMDRCFQNEKSDVFKINLKRK